MNSLPKRQHSIRWKSEAFFVDLIVAVMIGYAFIQGIRLTHNLEWPYEEDLYRNIGHAQTILDGDYFADDLYLGEKQWYNSLVPTIVAGASWISGLPVYIVYTKLGVYLNLLAPIFFYILLVRFIGRWAALASTFAFLFVIANGIPSWIGGTYAPWLLPVLFVQALVYMALLACNKVLQTGEWKWVFIVGILLGLVFMGHTAPAVLLGILMTLLTLQRTITGWKHETSLARKLRPLIQFGLLLLVAFIVSTPYHYTILGHYRLKILNPAPCNWVYEPLLLSNVRNFMNQILSRRLLLLFVIIGLGGLILRKEKRTERNILLLWLVIACGWIVHNYIWQMLRQRGIDTLRMLPAYHFVFYFHAAEAFLFGYGAVTVCRWLFKLVQYGRGLIQRFRLLKPLLHPRIQRMALLLLLTVTFVKVYPSYKARDDYREFRVVMNERPDWQQAYSWIRKNTRPTDVFLAPDYLGRFIVGPSGRKVVAVRAVFSNTYVEWAQRWADHEAMFEYAKQSNEDGFQKLTARYRVTHVIAFDQSKDIDDAAPTFLEKTFQRDKLSIYRYTG